MYESELALDLWDWGHVSGKILRKAKLEVGDSHTCIVPPSQTPGKYVALEWGWHQPKGL